MAKCIAFHSYKGGTGKTTIASNIAAMLTKKGFRVFLLDLDVYAPSLLAYFDKKPKRWLNDYLLGDADIDDIMTDVTPVIEDLANMKDGQLQGKLWIGFCSVKKEDVYRLESGSQESSKSQLRRFILLREHLVKNCDADYIIIDTSPGIRYWSINALAVADAMFLTLKMGDIDLEGTKRLATEIYGSLTKYGAKSFLLFNRVAGYCVPDISFQHGSQFTTHSHDDESLYSHQDVANLLSKETGMQVISSIPCYCDIQFSRKEFLTALRNPDHPFAKQVEQLIEEIKTKV